MFKPPCPSCGAEVVFRSTASVYAVCSYCKTASVRQDINLQSYGSMADVQMDATPLQIHTRGRYAGSSFELIGRLRVGWENGFWNEWVAMFEDGRLGWLAEAQGFYAMCFESDVENDIPEYEQMFTGREVLLKQTEKSLALHYRVDDIKTATCLGSEGELPFPAPKGRATVSIDLSTLQGRFATIEYTDEQTRIYLGEYVPFDAFEFSFLRELDGW